jgi:hypothetical protein
MSHFEASRSSMFMPHGGMCYLWRPEVVWLHPASDTVIALSYYLIVGDETNNVQHDDHIAIVDDDESVREAAVSLFRSMGLPVLSYGSAEEFLNSGMNRSHLVSRARRPHAGDERTEPSELP